MNSFQKEALITFQPHKKCRISKVEALRDNAILGLFPIRLDDGVIVSASRCLVVLLGNSRPIMTNSHGQTRKRFQISPILADDPHSCGQKSDDAGFTWLLPGIALVEAAGRAP